MNWQIEKRYFPSFKPLVDILRMYLASSSRSAGSLSFSAFSSISSNSLPFPFLASAERILLG